PNASVRSAKRSQRGQHFHEQSSHCSSQPRIGIELAGKQTNPAAQLTRSSEVRQLDLKTPLHFPHNSILPVAIIQNFFGFNKSIQLCKPKTQLEVERHRSQRSLRNISCDPTKIY